MLFSCSKCTVGFVTVHIYLLSNCQCLCFLLCNYGKYCKQSSFFLKNRHFVCGQRFVQAVASLVLIVESSHRYQNVATSVYFNLKKKSLRFCHILALKLHFRQLWFFENLEKIVILCVVSALYRRQQYSPSIYFLKTLLLQVIQRGSGEQLEEVGSRRPWQQSSRCLSLKVKVGVFQ